MLHRVAAVARAGLSQGQADDRRDRDHRPLPGTRPGPWPGRRPPRRGVARRWPAPRAAVCAPGPAGHGLAARRAAVAAAGPVHAAADAGRVGTAGRRAARRRPAVDSGPVAGRPAGRLARGPPGQEGAPWWAVAGVVAVAVGLGGRAADLSLRADHRPARSCLLHAVRGLDCPARLTADPAVPRGFRRPAPAHLRQPGLLPRRRRASCRSSWRDCRWRWPPPSGPAGSARRCWWHRCSGRQRCSPSAAWLPGWPDRAGRRSRPWPSRSPCLSSSPAGHPSVSRWRRSCSSAGSAWSSTR